MFSVTAKPFSPVLGGLSNQELLNSGHLPVHHDLTNCSVMPEQVVIEDDDDDDEGVSDAIEASEESSWLNTRGAAPNGQEAGTRNKERGSKQRSITSLLPKLPLGVAGTHTL